MEKAKLSYFVIPIFYHISIAILSSVLSTDYRSFFFFHKEIQFRQNTKHDLFGMSNDIEAHFISLLIACNLMSMHRKRLEVYAPM